MFWVDIMDIISILSSNGQKGFSNFQGLVSQIQPLIESFFLTYRILGDDEHLRNIRNKETSTKRKKPRKKMSISEFDFDNGGQRPPDMQ